MQRVLAGFGLPRGEVHRFAAETRNTGEQHLQTVPDKSFIGKTSGELQVPVSLQQH